MTTASHGDEGSESSVDGDGDWVVIDAATKRNTGLVLGDYVVSIIGRAKTKTLHRYGECYRQPGVHYRASCQRRRSIIEPVGYVSRKP